MKEPSRKRRDIVNCRRKLKYASLREAKAAAKRVKKMINQMIIWYSCPLRYKKQPHWHIGHPSFPLRGNEAQAEREQYALQQGQKEKDKRK
jgi:hypothetical protein